MNYRILSNGSLFCAVRSVYFCRRAERDDLRDLNEASRARCYDRRVGIPRFL
jgi:hypothetical protein